MQEKKITIFLFQHCRDIHNKYMCSIEIHNVTYVYKCTLPQLHSLHQSVAIIFENARFAHSCYYLIIQNFSSSNYPQNPQGRAYEMPVSFPTARNSAGMLSLESLLCHWAQLCPTGIAISCSSADWLP